MSLKRDSYEKIYSNKISGTEVNYFILCKRRCWLCRHNIMITKGNPHIIKGRILDEKSRSGHEDIRIGRNKIDVATNNKGELEVHEYKKGKKTRKSAKYQLLHYLMCLKEYGIVAVGCLHNLESKNLTEMTLDKKKEERLIKIYKSILKMDEKSIPSLEKKPLCHNGCSFEEFCWS